MTTPPPPPPGSLHWTVVGHADLAPFQTGFWLLTHANRDPSFSELHEVHEDLLLPAIDLFSQTCSNDVSTDLSRLRYFGFVSNIAEGLFWQIDGERGTGQAAPVATQVTWHVQDKGRGKYGHSYFPPPALADCDLGSQLSPAFHAHMTSQVDTFLSEISVIAVPFGGPLEAGVLHRQQDGQYLDRAQLRPIDGFRVGTRLSTQVKRLRHVKPST